MVERHHRAPMITFFWPMEWQVSEPVELHGDPGRHARARRIEAGEPARLLDGKGRVGVGEVVAVAKERVVVEVRDVQTQPRPLALEMVVPVADKERMLWAAEKCAELQVTAWRPAWFARSRSVSPRGEGEKFAEKLRARMQSALEQSGGAWLPDVHPEGEIGDVLRAVPAATTRLLMEVGGPAVDAHALTGPLGVAVGPEGGMTTEEIADAMEVGWRRAALGITVLRFETAIIAAASVARVTQFAR